MKKIVLFFVLLIIPISHLNSQTDGTCTWSGGGSDTNWTTADNWSSCSSSYPSGTSAIAKITGNSNNIPNSLKLQGEV